MYVKVPTVAGSRGLRVPEGWIEVEVTETTELDDELAVELVALWEDELDPMEVEDELELIGEVAMLEEDVVDEGVMLEEDVVDEGVMLEDVVDEDVMLEDVLDEDVRVLEEDVVDDDVRLWEDDEVVVPWVAVPVIKRSVYPPSLQNVRYEAEIPLTVGPKNSGIVIDAPAANWDPTVGKLEAV